MIATTHLTSAYLAQRWEKVRQYLTPTLTLRGWMLVLLMAVWLYLNIFDLLITYQGLIEGTAYEANRVFAHIIRIPVLAVAVKLSLAYLLLKLIERIEQRTPYSGMVPLLLVSLYVSWVCLHNLNILNGVAGGAFFLHFFPLACPPAH